MFPPDLLIGSHRFPHLYFPSGKEEELVFPSHSMDVALRGQGCSDAPGLSNRWGAGSILLTQFQSLMKVSFQELPRRLVLNIFFYFFNYFFFFLFCFFFVLNIF